MLERVGAESPRTEPRGTIAGARALGTRETSSAVTRLLLRRLLEHERRPVSPQSRDDRLHPPLELAHVLAAAVVVVVVVVALRVLDIVRGVVRATRRRVLRARNDGAHGGEDVQLRTGGPRGERRVARPSGRDAARDGRDVAARTHPKGGFGISTRRSTNPTARTPGWTSASTRAR
jgi:hypothetical protein